eukprot:jgi/Astpho2/6087/Aster-04034
MELRSPKGCIDLHGTQVTILGRQHLLEHFDLQSTNISSISMVNKGTNPVGVVKGADRRFMLVKGDEEAVLKSGDAIALLATEASKLLEVHQAPRGAKRKAEDALGPPTSASVKKATSPSRGGAPVVLLMVGPVGSGKSTFAGRLIGQGQAQWVRVNQDTISGTQKPGSRQQCLAAARHILQAGKSCIIDRTHVTKEQRADFLALARDKGAEAHAVVLNLESRVCEQRAEQRQGHEGHLEGPRARVAAKRMYEQLQKNLPSKAAEGLTSIMVAKSDGDVERALQAWTCYGSGTKPVDVWRKSGPLQSMFSRSQAPRAPAGKVLASAREAASSTYELLAGSSPATAGTSYAGDSLGTEHGSQNSTHLEAHETSQQLPAAGPSTSTKAEGTGHLPGQAPCTEAKAEGTGHLPGKAPCTEAKAEGPGQAPEARAEAPQSSNAFAKMMQAAKHSPPPAAKAVSSTKTAARDDWANRFKMLAANPERFASEYPEMQVDEQCLLINDKYPKAKRHALAVANKWASEQAGVAGVGPFKLGFHSVPSMRQLHLHVISQDFNSISLKNKKHWNTFTTAFFLPLSEVLRKLEAGIDNVHMDSLMEDIVSIDSAFMPPPFGHALPGRQIPIEDTFVHERLSQPHIEELHPEQHHAHYTQHGAPLVQEPESESEGTFFFAATHFNSTGGPEGEVHYRKEKQARFGAGRVADFEEHEYDSRTGLDKERISRHLGNRGSTSMRVRHADGREEVDAELHNLRQEELGQFDEDWTIRSRGLPNVRHALPAGSPPGRTYSQLPSNALP